MATSEFGTGKSIVVLAIVVGCFAILWPKIFYPMMQTAFSMTAPKHESEDAFVQGKKPSHIHPGVVHPRLREAMAKNEKIQIREGRPFPHPTARQPIKPQPKSGGAMGIIMPIYTIGIVVFFLYTVLKLVFKKPSEEEKKPIIKDFHMDPEYHKYVCEDTEDLRRASTRERKITHKKRLEDKKLEYPQEDYEIYQLRKRLEETEAAMERIMKHMGAVSECLATGRIAPDPPAPSSLLPPQNETSDSVEAEEGHGEQIEEQSLDDSQRNVSLICSRNNLKLAELESMETRHEINSEVSPDVESYEIISNTAATTPSEKLSPDEFKEENYTHTLYIQPPAKEVNTSEYHQEESKTSAIMEDTEKCAASRSPEPSSSVDRNAKLTQDRNELFISTESEEKKLHRESSVNSENSSFEVLSHGQENGSSNGERMSISPAGSEDSGHKDIDGNDSSSSGDNISFERISDSLPLAVSTFQEEEIAAEGAEASGNNSVTQKSLTEEDTSLNSNVLTTHEECTK